MENQIESISNLLLQGQATWLSFFSTSLVLALLYFALRFMRRILRQFNIWGKANSLLQTSVNYLLLIYEPLAVIILGSIFVLIHPLFHGLIMGTLMLVGYGHIRNYLSGRLMRLDRSLGLGSRLSTGHIKGIVSGMGRLGLYLQTNEGRHFVTYSHLAQIGYTVDPGEEIGGFYHLQVTANDAEYGSSRRFMDLLTTAPYLDWQYKPELITMPDNPEHLNVKVLFKEEAHLFELISLMKEWGYSTKILEN